MKISKINRIHKSASKTKYFNSNTKKKKKSINQNRIFLNMIKEIEEDLSITFEK